MGSLMWSFLPDVHPRRCRWSMCHPLQQADVILFLPLFTGGVMYPRLSDLSASGSKLAHHDIFMSSGRQNRFFSTSSSCSVIVRVSASSCRCLPSSVYPLSFSVTFPHSLSIKTIIFSQKLLQWHTLTHPLCYVCTCV